MGFKQLLEKMRGKNSEDSDYVKELSKRVRAEEIVMERKKSADERELERFYKEEREANIKQELEQMRKKRQKDIHFGHNMLNTKNVTNNTDWEILKDKQLFNSNGNMFTNQKNIFKDNRYLFD